jgi:aryl-alcohol dehydrogenase-like predicted oxidoreductase
MARAVPSAVPVLPVASGHTRDRDVPPLRGPVPPSSPAEPSPDRRARLGLGLAAVGRPAYITLGRDADLAGDRSPAALEARTHELLDAATGLGITYVDAARSYGEAERFLASWLRRSGRSPFVASKWGYRYVGGWRLDAGQHEVKEHTAAAFTRQWAETRELLGPWLRLYQVHSLTVDSPLWEDRELLARLAELRDAGTEVGFSTSGTAQAEAVRRGTGLEVGGRRLFDSVQSTWNLLERSAGGALAEAHAAGLRVVVKEGMANGRLAAGSPDAAPLERAGRDRGVGPDALALAAVLAQPWCDVVLSGAVTVAQLRSNAAAAGLADGAAGASVLDAVRPLPAGQYWAERGRLPWR